MEKRMNWEKLLSAETQVPRGTRRIWEIPHE